jgi:NAD(P)-dependent dehydrogenase (short-subunit alcohol dehydrogenase family)
MIGAARALARAAVRIGDGRPGGRDTLPRVPGRLDGTRIVVTGASRGLGRAIAEAAAAEGARLVLTATRRERLEAALAACRALGAEAEGIGLDLRDPAAIDAAAAGAAATLGRVDVLINNAGVLGVRAPLADYPLDVFEEVLDIGVVGTLRLIQRLLPAMADGGAIVNVTSGAAGRATWGAYSIAKLALDGITAMLREELAPRGIRCVAINPGGVRTGMRAAAYPREDPATVPHPSAVVEPFLAVAAGADPGPHVEAPEYVGESDPAQRPPRRR